MDETRRIAEELNRGCHSEHVLKYFENLSSIIEMNGGGELPRGGVKAA